MIGSQKNILRFLQKKQTNLLKKEKVDSYFCQNLGQKPLPLPANGVLVEKIHFFAYFWVKNASKSKIWGLPEACHISFFRYISVIHIFAKIWVENHCHQLPIEMQWKKSIFCLFLGSNSSYFPHITITFMSFFASDPPSRCLFDAQDHLWYQEIV